MGFFSEPQFKVILGPYGQAAAFKGDEQIPELQLSHLSLWIRHAEATGYDPTNFEVTSITPTGRDLKFKIIRSEDPKERFLIQVLE